MNTNLPTQDLKEYGIINEDNTFSKKLTEKDIQNFLNGHAIVADNGKDRLIFLLSENNTRLNVNIFERDKDLKDIFKQSEKEIVYSSLSEIKENNQPVDMQKKVFILDTKTNQIKELDLLKDIEKVAKEVAEKESAVESNRFRIELLKLKEHLQEKIDKFPEIAKYIQIDMNIVTNTIESVNAISPDEKQIKQQEKSNIQLNVNDQDRYEDANLQREKEQEQEQEQEQQQEIEVKRKTGFRR